MQFMKLAIHIQISQDFVPGKECYDSSSCGPNTPTASVSSAATPPEVELRFACQLPKPLQTPHNKLRALLLESLSAARFITPKWPHVAGPENVVRLPCPQSVTALLVECNAAQRAAADVTPCPQSLPSQ